MSLSLLRWVTVVGPLAFVLAVALAWRTLFAGLQPDWLDETAALAIIGVGVLLFSKVVLDRIQQMQESILRQNALLADLGAEAQERAVQPQAVNEAGLALASNLSLEVVVQRIVDLARELVGARYAALSVLDPNGDTISQFFTSGISPEERAKMGSLPQGRGLLGVVLREKEVLRVADLSQHPASVGFLLCHIIRPCGASLECPYFIKAKSWEAST
jgi:transcriptional regulator with GAF, ATPase, and Fis domain